MLPQGLSGACARVCKGNYKIIPIIPNTNKRLTNFLISLSKMSGTIVVFVISTTSLTVPRHNKRGSFLATYVNGWRGCGDAVVHKISNEVDMVDSADR